MHYCIVMYSSYASWFLVVGNARSKRAPFYSCCLAYAQEAAVAAYIGQRSTPELTSAIYGNSADGLELSASIRLRPGRNVRSRQALCTWHIL